MNAQEKTLARLRFKAMAAQVMGFAFQNLFTQIMGYARPDFSAVKPHGDQGDWKNDGHEPASGRYYQVYAPERIEEAKAVSKIETDFAGLVAKWGDKKVYPNGVTEFYFVLNDGYRITPGAYPETYATLAKLKTAHGLAECKPFLTKDLEEVLLGLPDDQLQTVIGFIPDPASIKVPRMDLISEVIGHIIDNPILRSLSQTYTAPDFDEKIQFNGLKQTERWLRAADFRRATVEQFFANNSDFMRQQVRDKLTAIYDASKAQNFQETGDGNSVGDQQFAFILGQIAPKTHLDSPRLMREMEEAALVVMAYFFESCDIFEEPKNASA